MVYPVYVNVITREKTLTQRLSQQNPSPKEHKDGRTYEFCGIDLVHVQEILEEISPNNFRYLVVNRSTGELLINRGL